jgi:uncharacterized protein YecE (DUF72 family)
MAIAHEARLNCSSEVLSAFLDQINCLHEKLGPVLIQLPPGLEFDYARARKGPLTDSWEFFQETLYGSHATVIC